MTAFLRIAPAVLFTTAAFAQNLQINEVRTDQFSTDNDEYFEIVGPPGFSLDGYGYVVIGDGGGAGIGGGIDAAISLDGYVIPADGYLLVAESSFTLGVADYTTSLNFENSDNVTHLLVEGTLPASGDDLDTDDDGVIDAAPWNSVIDGIALVETPASGELYYDNLPNTVAIGPNGNFAPAHVYRCILGLQLGAFFLGDDSETPGERNLCDDPRINEIRIDQSGTDNDEYFEIAGPPGFSLDGYGYVVIGDGSGVGQGGGVDAAIPLDGYVIPADGHLLVAESSFTLDAADYTTSINFENSDNVTHILVEGTLPASGDDLDTDDDGVIDAAPWNSVIDGIALVETVDPLVDGGELYYDNLPNTSAIGPNGNFVPCPVYRCGNDFRVGDFFDLGGFLETPGDPNICSAPTGVFCSPAVANSVSMAGSLLNLASASEGSIAANDSLLVVTDTPDDFGIFAQSMSVMAPVRLTSGGDLCLGYPDTQRLSAPIMASGNTASLALDFTSGPASGVAAGVTMYYQWWHRDMTAGGSNLSEGLSVTWLE
ncbi:MAG: hypothetical protein VX015_11560 [Planctomycetota bacterium]|nr:hypothetical protein [Planctomycetota bacterium]